MSAKGQLTNIGQWPGLEQGPQQGAPSHGASGVLCSWPPRRRAAPRGSGSFTQRKAGGSEPETSEGALPGGTRGGRPWQWGSARGPGKPRTQATAVTLRGEPTPHTPGLLAGRRDGRVAAEAGTRLQTGKRPTAQPWKRGAGRTPATPSAKPPAEGVQGSAERKEPSDSETGREDPQVGVEGAVGPAGAP